MSKRRLWGESGRSSTEEPKQSVASSPSSVQPQGEQQLCRCGNGSSISERSEYSEACRSIGMAVPRGLLRGYGDRREEASFASKSVDNIKKQKNLTK